MEKFFWVGEFKRVEIFIKLDQNCLGFFKFFGFGVGSGSKGEERRQGKDIS